MNCPDFIKNIIQYLREELDPDAIVLFGSLVTGAIREDSDVDIAFLSEKEVPPVDLFFITQRLAGKLNRDVDLVDLKKASTVFQAQIVGKGSPIYIRDKRKYAEFQIRALKDYVILNEERAQILKNIAQRGRVYN
ncbi:MAG: type VII toxin-antitoxin system MntA family adenylyltransferase antitoxin [Desulfitobacteriia bacterium]